MLDYKLLEALALVIHEKGFDKAAQKLNIPQSAVSQRIKQLEDQIGQVLLTRTTPPRATRDASRLIKHYMQVKTLEAEVEKNLGTDKEKNYQVFPMGINADSLATWFFPAVGNFLKHRRILLDLKVDDQDETHKLLKNGEVSGCVSSSKTPVQGCRVTYIGTMTYRLLATKGFANIYFRNGMDEKSIEIAPAVIFNRKDDLHDLFFKEYFKKTIKNIPIHYVPSSEKFFQMVADGLAYGMVPDFQGLDLIRSGKLLDLAPACPVKVDLYWHRWNLKSKLLDEFSRAIVKNALIC